MLGFFNPLFISPYRSRGRNQGRLSHEGHRGFAAGKQHAEIFGEFFGNLGECFVKFFFNHFIKFCDHGFEVFYPLLQILGLRSQVRISFFGFFIFLNQELIHAADHLELFFELADFFL